MKLYEIPQEIENLVSGEAALNAGTTREASEICGEQ